MMFVYNQFNIFKGEEKITVHMFAQLELLNTLKIKYMVIVILVVMVKNKNVIKNTFIILRVGVNRVKLKVIYTINQIIQKNQNK